MRINLPHKFIPYDFQADTFRAFFVEGYKMGVSVLHRRGGKTIKCTTILVGWSMQRVGLYYHSFPTAKQARAACFEGMDNDGIPMIERIPRELINRVNNVDMKVYLVNGSVIHFIGTDNFNAKMGANPMGMIYDEYSLQKPEVRNYMAPIFRRNGGWQYFIYTPRGKNHGYDLKEMAANDPKIYYQLKTVEETFDHEGNRLITDDMIQEERRLGIPEEIIQQEYYCSFDASLVGNFYGDHIKLATEQGRICDFDIDPTLPVYTVWDLGGAKEGSDATAVWFFQKNKNMIDVIYYHETNLTPLTKFPAILLEIEKKTGAQIARNFAPCDINVVEMTSGKSRLSIAKSVGLHFQVLPGKLWNKPKIDGIECVWRIFYKLRFHKTNCELGLRALNEYRKEWSEKRKCYGDEPRHDWTSHAADAFRYFALIWADSIGKVPDSRIIPLGHRTYGGL